MQTTPITTCYVIPRLGLAKKKDDADKGTTRKTPGSNEGARPPKKEDFDKAKNENDKKGANKGK
jgi:hypothetical protein